MGVVVVALALAAAAYAAPRRGLEWPYPQRLPGSFVSHYWPHHPWNYDKASGCQSASWWKRQDRNFYPLRRVGTMPSAWWFGGSALLAQGGGDLGLGAAAFLPTVWVKTDAGCFVLYQPRKPVPP
jgi:hypothetical protein